MFASLSRGRRSLAALLAAVVVAGVLSAAPAYAVPVSLQGHVYGSNTSTPLQSVSVFLHQSTAPSVIAIATTDAAGYYAFDSLATGSYTLSFNPSSNYVPEYFDNAASYATATFFSITANAAAVNKDAVLTAGATIAGTVTGNGVALAGVSAVVIDANGGGLSGLTTDSAGHYAVSGLGTGPYTVMFVGPSAAWATEWNGNAISRFGAPAITPVSGNTTTVNADLATSSTISGTMKTTANANLTGKVFAYQSSGNDDAISVVAVATVTAGAFSLTRLPVGAYKLGYTTSTASEYQTTELPPATGGYVAEYYNNAYSFATAQVALVSSAGSAYSGWNVQLEFPHFQDVADPANAVYPYIQWMFDQGISTGTPNDGTKPFYKPSDPVSRQAMALFLFRLSGQSFTSPATATFADVPSSSGFYQAIEWMADAGISVGTPQPSGKPLYNPSAAVSRQSMAFFLARFAGAPTTGSTAVQYFADVPPASSSAVAINWMYTHAISTGTPQPSGLPLYKPADAVSRSAMAAFLYRYAHPS